MVTASNKRTNLVQEPTYFPLVSSYYSNHFDQFLRALSDYYFNSSDVPIMVLLPFHVQRRLIHSKFPHSASFGIVSASTSLSLRGDQLIFHLPIHQRFEKCESEGRKDFA